MPRTNPSPHHKASSAPAASGFAAADWRLLTRLPAEVMIATISAEEGPRRTVAEGLAGLDAIAGGRGSDSDLVRAVVAAIYAEPEDPPASERTDGPAGRRTQVLNDCRRAAELLRVGADAADSTAYRHWLQQVALRVCGASRSGGVFGLAGETISAGERAFLDDLATALL